MLEMMSYLNNGYDVMKCFVAHSIIMPNLYLSKSKAGAFVLPPYKIGSQTTPYKLGLKCCHLKYHRTNLNGCSFFALSEVEIRKLEL